MLTNQCVHELRMAWLEKLSSQDFLDDFVLEGVKVRGVNGFNFSLDSLAPHLL